MTNVFLYAQDRKYNLSIMYTYAITSCHELVCKSLYFMKI